MGNGFGLSRQVFTGAILFSALSAGALATIGLATAPTANASCASFLGIGNSADCTSSPTSIAIAIGAGAQAHATGLFGAAFAVGNATHAETNTVGTGLFDLAAAFGADSLVIADGVLGAAISLGTRGAAEAGYAAGGDLVNVSLNVAGAPNSGCPMCYRGIALSSGNVNMAINLGGNRNVGVGGDGNLALNMFGNNQIGAVGTLNVAAGLFGNNNLVNASGPHGGTAGWAFSVGGSNNVVTAGPGPLAVAGSILQTGAHIHKTGPGININGVVVGGAAAVPQTKAATASAMTTRHAAVVAGAKK